MGRCVRGCPELRLGHPLLGLWNSDRRGGSWHEAMEQTWLPSYFHSVNPLWYPTAWTQLLQDNGSGFYHLPPNNSVRYKSILTPGLSDKETEAKWTPNIPALWGCKRLWGRCACKLSYVRLLVTPWTIAHQAPLSIGFSRQENWSRLPFPSPGDLPDPGTEPASPALAGGFFTTEPPRKPLREMGGILNDPREERTSLGAAPASPSPASWLRKELDTVSCSYAAFSHHEPSSFTFLHLFFSKLTLLLHRDKNDPQWQPGFFFFFK